MRFALSSTSSVALGASLFAASLFASAVATPALAADAAAPATEAPAVDAPDAGIGVETITVTARRRDEKLQDVPLAISTVSGLELAAQHLDRVADYALKVPNFSALQQNTRVSGLFIRGLGGNASNDGAEGGVGLIVDNVFFTHVGFSWLDFVDLEGIEVVRGPQGTLLGKNTTIGAVIVKTAKPSFDPSLKVSASYGENNAWQVRANATGALVDDKLAARLTFATSQGGGWIPNKVDGVKYLNNNRWSVRGQLLFTPSPSVSSRLIAEHYETHEYNNFYPPAGDVNFNLKTDGSVFSTAANPTGARAGSWTNKLIARFGYNPSFAVPYNANLDNQQRLTSRTDGLSNEVNADLGGAELTAVTAWRRLYFRPYNDSDYTPLAILRGGYDVDVDQYSQEVRLASKGTRKVDWTVGAYFLHEDLRSNLRTILFKDASTFLVAPGVPSAVLNGVEYDRDGKLKVDSLAGFGQATWHVNDAFSITGGVRYTHETKRANVAGYSIGGATLALPVLAGTRAAVLASLGGTPAALGGVYAIGDRSSRGSVAWLVNPSFKVNDNILLYASASYGEKSGAANTAATLSQAAVVLTQPEKSLDFEGGIKTTWAGGKLTANLNLYNNTIKGYQDTQIDQTNPSFGAYLGNVGKVRLRGFEFEVAGRPTAGVTVYANAAYNDAKYLSYDNSPAPLEFQAYLATQQGVAAAATTLSLTGYQLRNAPKWTLQGGVDLDTPVNDAIALTGYANTTWKSRIAYINPRSVYGWQAPIAVVNAGIGIRTLDGKWTAGLWSKNLFNKIYAATFSPATGSAPTIEILSDRRSFGVQVARKF
ncbi:TonB-dependent receptor [Novosphingobium sp. FKTRR1]|uniref:TonB-dependent receptor n=1 Tax=Novosphingobium sp. FKTRR1 TaxID=2879118 RepID=UPI001CEFC31C|nr:TonB-dependent receptor [Novosphingobium sp. FKTRR1]